ncbi:phage scaffolding protein [Halocella sp. SP3-1]|uniref:phage scaffolding protein n=1 Tax=Halocella sp. SP3-1 TaxID=2382161 RepID=UPI0013DFB219|nr:phage scaffolding protein [Halocella sp. SP3-1]
MDKLIELLTGIEGFELTDELKGKIKNVWDNGVKSGKENLFTQEEVNKLIDKRFAREAKLHEQEITDLKEQMKGMVDPDKVQEYETKIQELETQATENKANIKKEYELKLAAVNNGVRKEAIDDFLKIADTSALEIGEDGNVTGMDELMENMKENKGYLFAEDATPGGGEEFKGGGGGGGDDMAATKRAMGLPE